MPSRWVARLTLLVALTFVSVHAPVRGQGAGKEKIKVTYVDRKDGKIYSQREYDLVKESAAGLEVQILKETKFIPSADILRVDYTIPGITFDQIAAGMKEESDDPAKAAKRYADLQKMPGLSPKGKRYLEYREAVSLSKVAEAKTGEEFKTEAEKAIKLLSNFAKNDSWEAWAATRQAARYQMELGQFEKAAENLSSLSANKALTKDLILEAKIASEAAKLRGGSEPTVILGAAKDLEAQASGPVKQRATVLRMAAEIPKGKEGTAKPAQAIKLEQALQTTITDPYARSLGYGLLGHIYRDYGLTRDAMWAFLWVDVVNNQDKDEEMLAVKNLVEVFAAVGEPDRSMQYKDKLPKVR